jgi:FkbM family methyltransferase
VADRRSTRQQALLDPLTDDPRVLVVVPAYNAAMYVGDAVRSVRASTGANWRCVVVDDGSDDGTADVAREAADGDRRVTVVTQPNRGVVSAIGRAGTTPTAAGCELVALLDSDDLFLPRKLATVAEVMRARPRAGLAVHRLYVADSSLRIIGVSPIADRLLDGDLRERLQRSAAGDARLGVSSGMVLRRAVFDRIFLPEKPIRRAQDELVRRIAPLLAEVVACETPLGIRRAHGSNITDRSMHDLAASLEDTVASYRLIRTAQDDVAAEVAIRLPSGDPDLDLARAVIAALTNSDDRATSRRTATATEAFTSMTLARRAYWHVTLRLPRPLLRRAVGQLAGTSTAKLLLNRRALRKLQRRGTVPRPLPLAELGTLGLLRRIAATSTDAVGGEQSARLVRPRLHMALRRTIVSIVAIMPESWVLRVRARYLAAAAPRWARPGMRALLSAARLGGLPVSEPFTIPGAAPLRMSPADSFVTQRVYWLGVDGYEPGETAWWAALASAHTSILELGANVGLYTIVGAAASPRARYRAVEPNPVTCDVLRENVTLNDLAHVEVVEAAVVGARAADSTVLHIPDRDLYTASAGAYVDGAVDIDTPASRVVTVPTMATDALVDGVDLLKLDIEGLELEVLEAARPWLVRTRPTIVVEVRDDARRLQAFVEALVAEADYECYAVRSHAVVGVDAATVSGRLERDLGTRDLTLLPTGRRAAVQSGAEAAGLAWR